MDTMLLPAADVIAFGFSVIGFALAGHYERQLAYCRASSTAYDNAVFQSYYDKVERSTLVWCMSIFAQIILVGMMGYWNSEFFLIALIGMIVAPFMGKVRLRRR